MDDESDGEWRVATGEVGERARMKCGESASDLQEAGEVDQEVDSRHRPK